MDDPDFNSPVAQAESESVQPQSQNTGGELILSDNETTFIPISVMRQILISIFESLFDFFFQLYFILY